MIDLLASVEVQRGIPATLLLEAIEEALTTAARIEYADAQAVAAIDRVTGDIKVFIRRTVVEVVTDPATECAPVTGYAPGDFFDTPVDTQGFSRIAALTARQVVARRVIEFERERVFSRFRLMEGSLVYGLVQRTEGGHVYALMDNDNEALLPRGDYFGPPPAINEWVYVVIDSVRKTPRGPAILLSRASETFVAALLPGWGVVAMARDPGVATIVACTTAPPKFMLHEVIDRARAELGEPIYWVPWSDEPSTLIASAISALGGGDIDFVMIDNDVAIVPPVDADLTLVSRLANLRVVGSDDLAATRAELEAERLAYAMQSPSSPLPPAGVTITAEQMATLLRFRDEREA